MRLRRLLGPVLAAAWLAAPLHAGCPEEGGAFPAVYTGRDWFEPALAATAEIAPAGTPLTGLTLPHHLAAAELIAGGLRLATGQSYDRIVVLHPDHFNASARPFATTPYGFDTRLGPVPGDPEGAARLLTSGGPVEPSCLFARDHGLRALLPFLARLFPGTPVLPVAVSIRSGADDWQALAQLLAPLIGGKTLVLQSTDFSHYLPHHQARVHDQQSLNVIAAGDPAALTALTMPDHLDSKGAMHLQMVLQAGQGAAPIVVQNRNQAELGPHDPASTTSYVVIAWGRFPPTAQALGLNGAETLLLAGDTFFGRSLAAILSDELAERRLGQALDGLTAGLPLVVNLEGVLLEDMPGSLGPMVLGMPTELALDWARRANVRGVSLANNHARDIGAFGYDETRRALTEAGIAVAGPGERLDIGHLSLVALSDLGNSRTGQRNLLDEAALGALLVPDPARAVVAFVHWGREYVADPGLRERDLARAIARHGAAAIVGAHPHVASPGITLTRPDLAASVYSLGNFIFDQTAARASGAMVEITTFPQGTVFLRQVPLPNLYEIARGG